MKKLITAVLGGTTVATLAFASASMLNVDGGTIQAGGDSTLYCDTDGVKANWGLDTETNSVSSVRISGIDAACEGAEMFIKVNDVPRVKMTLTDADSQSVKFPAPVTSESLESIQIWIEG
ncbi:hypothetical protein ACQE98_00480 [Ornithinimicrobium sp. W1679]|uniref:hypothetical protein n=1 Tax=Ornithinimicrobium sp. W1679 TaxID=3418770 RepID=UPI003CF2E117